MNDQTFMQRLRAMLATETDHVKRHRIQRAMYYTGKRLLGKGAG